MYMNHAWSADFKHSFYNRCEKKTICNKPASIHIQNYCYKDNEI